MTASNTCHPAPVVCLQTSWMRDLAKAWYSVLVWVPHQVRDDRKVILGLVGAILLSACQADTPATEAPQSASSTELVTLKGYRSDDMGFMGVSADMPYDEAVASVTRFLNPEEPVEGNFKFSVVTEETGNDEPIVTVLTADGMMDDSVKAMQVKLVSGTGRESGKLKQYGARIKCWRGGNSNMWSTKECS